MRKQFIHDALAFARNYTTTLLGKFESPDQWVSQPAADTNHALWCAGHLAHTDNFAISLLAPEHAGEPDGYAALFGAGSTPQPDADAYPAPAAVLNFLNERRQRLLTILEGFSEDDLDRPTPAGAPDFVPTVESVFRLLVWHEGLHAGQASIAHRALGRQPIMG